MTELKVKIEHKQNCKWKVWKGEQLLAVTELAQIV